MAKEHCVPCWVDRNLRVEASGRLEEVSMCVACLRNSNAPPPASSLPADDLCSRGCGRLRHPGRCKGGNRQSLNLLGRKVAAEPPPTPAVAAPVAAAIDPGLAVARPLPPAPAAVPGNGHGSVTIDLTLNVTEAWMDTAWGRLTLEQKAFALGRVLEN